METIRVPRPPAGAFNKNRRVSDLIRAQVNHFKHIEQKLSAEQRRTIPLQGVTTEAEAAQYIAAITAALRAQPAAAPLPSTQAVPSVQRTTPRPAARPVPAKEPAIAAAATQKAKTNAPAQASLASAPKKKGAASNGGPGPAPKEKK